MPVIERRRRRYWIALVVILMMTSISALLYVTRLGRTPPFRDASGGVLPGSVASMERVRLGDVEQSIVIRGRSAKAPILIWLHGGPGMDETGMWRRNNAALEDHFLVIYWTQRGTGRSYDSAIPATSMRLSRFVADLDELVDLMRARFNQRRVVLVGHSWGTSIGVAYAQAHPDKVAAYVGVGQVVDAAEGERRSYAFTLAEAARRHDTVALADLRRIGPPPYPMSSLLVQRDWLNRFGGAWHRPRDMPGLMLESFGASEVTLLDGITYARGEEFSLDALQGDTAKVNWMRDATHFAMPVFIMAGRYDHNTDGQLQYEYFQRITAPAKRFIWFEASAHSPPFEQAEAFNSAMIRDVLPVAIARSR